MEEVQADPRRAFLLTVEHVPPVITLGRRGSAEHILASRERLAELGIEAHQSQRGGQVTYHGPGQLVAYPILHIGGRPGGLRRYVHDLEEAVIRVLRTYGVEGRRADAQTGVWVGDEKIAAIGVAVSRWVAWHGLALNVSTHLSHYDLIVPCGASGTKQTSLERLLGRSVPIEEARLRLVDALTDILFAQAEDLPRPGQQRLTASPDRAIAPSIAPGVNRQSPIVNRQCPGRRLPAWLVKSMPRVAEGPKVRRILEELGLATVCSDARCPNRPECYASGTATFLIMGRNCTRACRFCAIDKGAPEPLREDEPAAVAEASRRMGLKHVVITSVTRDDLPDGGAWHFAKTIRAVRKATGGATIEVLVPDFQGSDEAVATVIDARPDVFNHNTETVPRLYAAVRPQADYRRSLGVLSMAGRLARQRGIEMMTKSGIMVGLGETGDEIEQVMHDLRAAGCDILTIGQYLSPSPAHMKVERFVPPEEFEALRRRATDMGFAAVAAGPFVRSSYQARQIVDRLAAESALHRPPSLEPDDHIVGRRAARLVRAGD